MRPPSLVGLPRRGSPPSTAFALPKRGAATNELTQYRYDVLIHVRGTRAAEPTPPPPCDELSGEADGGEGLRARVADAVGAGRCAVVRGLPNSRLQLDGGAAGADPGEVAAAALLPPEGAALELACSRDDATALDVLIAPGAMAGEGLPRAVGGAARRRRRAARRGDQRPSARCDGARASRRRRVARRRAVGRDRAGRPSGARAR